MGNVDDYKVGARVLNHRGKFFLLRTADGFKALYQVCTHLGCLDREMDGGYAYPCHGSFFSPDGRPSPVAGPPPLRLPGAPC